jgi:predicted phosphoribosyltransferase
MDSNTAIISKQSFYTFEQFSNDFSDLSESEIRAYIEARNKARRELNFL